MKAILVIDKMPKNCGECEYCGFSVEDPDERSCILAGCYMLYNFDVESGRLECCPLRPLPQRMRTDGDDIEEDSYWQGWNGCIDEITGETE